jgi:Peptidase A4 family
MRRQYRGLRNLVPQAFAFKRARELSSSTNILEGRLKNKLFIEVAARFWTVGLSVAIALCGVCSVAMANGTPPAGSVASDQSVVQGIITYPQPQAGLDRLSASDVELEQNGYPPRPDIVSAPKAYAHWKKLVSVPRSGNPILQATTVYAGPAQHAAAGRTGSGGIVSATTSNWSGYAVTAPSGTFAQNNSFIFAEWVVPVAQQTFGACHGGWDWSFQWDGFDGAFFSGDVLQAGTEADAYCSGSTKASFYSSWIEWYPFSETRVSVPAAQPGDLMGSEVWYTTSAPYGHAYLVNYTLQQSQSYAFNPPSGTNFVGDTAEWVVERPTVGGSLPDLTNYVADPFNFNYAYNGSSYFYPGSSPFGTTTYAISMTCPPWSPSSVCSSTSTISAPYLYGLDTMWFYDFYPAY